MHWFVGSKHVIEGKNEIIQRADQLSDKMSTNKRRPFDFSSPLALLHALKLGWLVISPLHVLAIRLGAVLMN